MFGEALIAPYQQMGWRYFHVTTLRSQSLKVAAELGSSYLLNHYIILSNWKSSCATHHDFTYIFWYLVYSFQKDCTENFQQNPCPWFFLDLWYLSHTNECKNEVGLFERKLSERPECHFGVYDRDWCLDIGIVCNKFYVSKNNLEGLVGFYAMLDMTALSQNWGHVRS